MSTKTLQIADDQKSSKHKAELTTCSDDKITAQDVKKYFCEAATDKEIALFLGVCKSHGLDPWRREAYLIKYGSSPAQIVVGKDTFTRRAQQNHKFRGFSAGIIVERNKQVLEVEGAFQLNSDILIGGWAQVHVADYVVPIKAYVSMKEFGKQQSTWKQMPATMIRKVALVSALREAFPDELGGLYDSSEMGADIDKPQTKPQEIKSIEVAKKIEEVKDVSDAEVFDIVENQIAEQTQNPEPVEVKETEVEKPKRGRPAKQAPTGTAKERCENAFAILEITEKHQTEIVKSFDSDWDLLLHNLNEVGKSLKGKDEADRIHIVSNFLGMYTGGEK